MEEKKAARVNLEKNRVTYFLMGLTVALGFIFIAFELSNTEVNVAEVEDSQAVVEEEVMVEIIGENAAYMNFYGMTLLEGDMLASSSSDTDLVLNETAVKAFGWDKAVGKHLPAHGYT